MIDILNIRTECAVRAIMNGICGHRGENKQQAGYVSFRCDLIELDEEERHTNNRKAWAIHLLKWGGRIIGAINRDFVSPSFHKPHKPKEWVSISTHDSCWPDSTYLWMGRELDYKTEVGKKYWCHFSINGVEIIPVADLLDVVYDADKTILVPEFMYGNLKIKSRV